MNAEWFKTWFDSPYYHQLYKDRNDQEAQKFLRNLFSKINIDKRACILDLACGRGRHSRYLNSLGFNVTGMDLSHSSIEWAQQFQNDSLHFIQQDMREEIKGNKFDCILNLFTSFGYFDNKDENEKVLNSVSKMMKDDSYFVIDFLNVKKITKELVKEEEKWVDGLLFTIKRNVENGQIIKNIGFSDRGTHFNFSEKVQAFDLNDLTQLLEKADLKIERTFGSYNMDEFDEENSDRLIIISKRK